MGREWGGLGIREGGREGMVREWERMEKEGIEVRGVVGGDGLG